jgi:aminopeptidase YwaD
MKKVFLCTLIVVLTGLCLTPLLPQEREDRTLLPSDQMRAIINEVSGERPLHAVLEMVPYPRVRGRAEYEGNFQESVVMARLAREYGFKNVEIESFPGGAQSWQASQGELWMTVPESRKLYDIYDMAFSLASGSQSADVTADLVDVGIGGRAEDFAGKDVKGKIVLGSASAGTIANLAIRERGAVGVLSYNSLRAPDSYPDQIMNQSVSASGQQAAFGWSISPRTGHELAQLLAQGKKVTLRSIVKAEGYPGEMETVHAMIPGDGSSDQEIAISGHLYEGYIKQGANDDASGCAVTLEMGRAYLRLVEQGKLPKPKRNIHFLWVPEISGTMAWLAKHEDTRKKLIADLNFDMEGLGLRLSYATWVMHRTPDTFPTFLNDLCESVLRWVAETNRERVRYRALGYRYTLPILAPTGSTDPFWITVDKHYGASDHVVYMRNGVPSIMFITWPDMYYHSSADSPDKLDATQFKRAGVVGTAGMSILASAGDEMAARVAAEALGRGAERMGEAQRKGLAYMADITAGPSFQDAYKEARVAVKHQAGIEKEVVKSSAVLFANPSEAQKQLASFETLIDQRAAAFLNESKAFYEMGAQKFKLTAAEPAMTDLEKQASRLIVEQVGGAGRGFGGGGGGGRGQGTAGPAMSAEDRAAMQAAMRKIPQHMTAELNILLGKSLTAVEIRDFLSGEFEPLPLADLMEYLRVQEKSGAVKLTEKPEEPKPAPAPAPKSKKPAPKKP